MNLDITLLGSASIYVGLLITALSINLVTRALSNFFSQWIATRLHALFSPSAASFRSAHTISDVGVLSDCLADIR